MYWLYYTIWGREVGKEKGKKGEIESLCRKLICYTVNQVKKAHETCYNSYTYILWIGSHAMKIIDNRNDILHEDLQQKIKKRKQAFNHSDFAVGN